MAATTTTAVSAAADVSKPAGSGASTTSSTAASATPSPEFLPAMSYDVEDMLAAEGTPVADTTKVTEDPKRDDEKASAEGETPGAEASAEEIEATGDEAANADEGSDEPEVLQDETTGKKLVGARHFERMLKQRNAAKHAEREAREALELEKAKTADLESKLTSGGDKPVVTTDLPLTRLAPQVNPNNPEHLTQLEQHAQDWLNWCERHPTGGAPGDGSEEWDTDRVVDQKRWANAVLKAIPEHRKFQTDFTTERAKVKAENPQMFQAGTEEHKAHGEYQRKLLNFRTAADQDAIIAKLIKLDRMETEERTGVASYPRVPKTKAAIKTDGDKPKPKPVTVITRPLGSVKPGSAEGVTKTTLAEKLAAGPADVEALFGDPS